MEEKDHLALYSRKCKSCGYLDPDEPKKYAQCHYSKGNVDCPASGVQIVVVGKARSMARKVIAARNKRDTVVESRLLVEVSKQNDAFRAKFYSFIENPESLSGESE